MLWWDISRSTTLTYSSVFDLNTMPFQDLHVSHWPFDDNQDIARVKWNNKSYSSVFWKSVLCPWNGCVCRLHWKRYQLWKSSFVGGCSTTWGISERTWSHDGRCVSIWKQRHCSINCRPEKNCFREKCKQKKSCGWDEEPRHSKKEQEQFGENAVLRVVNQTPAGAMLLSKACIRVIHRRYLENIIYLDGSVIKNRDVPFYAYELVVNDAPRGCKKWKVGQRARDRS